MSHPLHHAMSSVRKFGGTVDDYIPLHNFFDESKGHHADLRHRALRHHAQGIFWAEQVFGVAITNSDGRVIPVRWIGEQHVREDLGFIPSLTDWLENIQLRRWMLRQAEKLPESLPPRGTHDDRPDEPAGAPAGDPGGDAGAGEDGGRCPLQ